MRDSSERSEAIRDIPVDKICIAPAENGYIIEILRPNEEEEKWIMGNARVMLHLLAGFLGYDLEIKSMTPTDNKVNSM